MEYFVKTLALNVLHEKIKLTPTTLNAIEYYTNPHAI